MTGEEFETSVQEINGGDPIGRTLLFQYLNLAKAMVEGLRPWMILRSTDTSKTVSASSGSAWQTGISLADIARFNRFYADSDTPPIQLFDGSNRIEDYWPRPFNQRLRWRDTAGTFVFDEATKTLYLNGPVSFSGSLWINLILNSEDLSIDSLATAWPFPSYAHQILAHMAVAMNKGAVDFDEINRMMTGEHRAIVAGALSRLESWDSEKALAVVDATRPDDAGDFRLEAERDSHRLDEQGPKGQDVRAAEVREGTLRGRSDSERQDHTG